MTPDPLLLDDGHDFVKTKKKRRRVSSSFLST